VNGSIDDEQVVSTIDLGVSVNNNTSITLGSHLSGTDVVASGLERLDKVCASNVGNTGRSNQREGGVATLCHGNQTVHHHRDGLSVDVRGHVGVGDEGSGAISCDTKATDRLQTVGDVNLHLDGVVGRRVASTLEENLAAVSGVDR
jgi:hypothetical protein